VSLLSKVNGMRASKIQVSMFFILFLSFVSCREAPVRAFYYWKSVFSLSEKEREYLRDLEIRRLYIRFFDVDKRGQDGEILPVATIRFAGSIEKEIDVIPVVYITNRTLFGIGENEISDLAEKIVAQIDRIASENNILFCEMQLDCDWSDKTRNNYFRLVEGVKKRYKEKDITVSVTIRLHQVKYMNMTGVPPADRGMLMYYNMGKIEPGDSPNSIFNANVASKYIDYLHNYPMPLDIALPAFSWGVHVRNGSVMELLNNMNISDFCSDNRFIRTGASTFTARDSFFFRGFYFISGDVVKVETISPDECLEAARQLEDKLPGIPGTVTIFHLDSLIISQYEEADFEKIFNTYN